MLVNAWEQTGEGKDKGSLGSIARIFEAQCIRIRSNWVGGQHFNNFDIQQHL